jgi:L-fuculose-phosphate aldolase
MFIKREIQQLIEIGKRIVESNLVSGTGGNISVRTEAGIAITVTGSRLNRLTEKEIVLIDLATGDRVKRDAPRPSCEFKVHLACYLAKPDINAIVHCHPVWTIGVVSGHGHVPPMFPEFIDDVDSIGYVDFVLPSTREMGEKVSKVMSMHNVCVIRNHGVFAGGGNLDQAFNRVIIIEDSAKTFAIANMVGQATCLTDEQADQVRNLEATQYRRQLSGMKV